MFSAKADGHADVLMYAPKTWTGQFFGISGEGLYVVDDNGKRLDSLGGFRGGRQTALNSNVQRIDLNSGEEVILTARFPMISEGAQTVSFIAPTLDGWQPGWKVDSIRLKPGVFDQ